MDTNKSLMWKTASTYGLIVGAVLVLMALLIWLAQIEQSVGVTFVNWLVVTIAVYMSMKTWRDRFMQGIIKYNQALGFGVAVMFFASIIFAVYNVIYMNYLEPETIEKSLDFIEESYYNMGQSEEFIEEAMVTAAKLQTPFWQALSAIFGTTLLGLVISLIVAIFIRKEGDPFKTAMRSVEPTNNDSN